MNMTLGDWIFEVDIPQTMERSGAHAADHCTCGYCENFYRTVDSVYPHMRSFLTGFGVNIEGPDEFCPFEPTICEATYVVCGKILQHGSLTIHVDGVPVLFQSSLELDHALPQPSFGIVVGLMDLPWVLDEPMEEVVSPANEPECLDRMWKKLIKRNMGEHM